MGGRNPARVVFKFAPENGDYKFCRSLGDGVFLKKNKPDLANHKQFVKMFGTDDDGIEDNASDDEVCTKRFRFKFRNRVQTTPGAPNPAPEETPYEYTLVFRDKAGTLVCTKDPWVKNGK